MDHRLPQILAYAPRFNEPLSLVANSLTCQGRDISVIDVGANIGDTVALIEKSSQGHAQYLCIEPNQEFFRLCVHNLRAIPKVQVLSAVIGDRTDADVKLVEHRPGTASARVPTRDDQPVENVFKVVRLDSVAMHWVSKRGLDLIKCDTDGFDFPVLRSAAALLDLYHPSILFEWHPDLWISAGEDPTGIFEYLFQHGYRNLVFFTNQGQFFCATSLNDETLFNGLKDLCLARNRIDDMHFDVLAADEKICKIVVEKSTFLIGEPD